MKRPIPVTRPSEEYKRAAYEIYKAIFEQRNVLGHNRVPLMTNLFGRQRWSWRVTAISTGALQTIKDNEFRHAQALQRDHFIQKRDTTFKSMLPDDGAMFTQDELWSYFWKNDATILMTKEEHYKTPDEDIELIKLDWKDGYFACKKLVGFDFRKTIEGALLRDVLDRMSSGELTPISIPELKSELERKP